MYAVNFPECAWPAHAPLAILASSTRHGDLRPASPPGFDQGLFARRGTAPGDSESPRAGSAKPAAGDRPGGADAHPGSGRRPVGQEEAQRGPGSRAAPLLTALAI